MIRSNKQWTYLQIAVTDAKLSTSSVREAPLVIWILMSIDAACVVEIFGSQLAVVRSDLRFDWGHTSHPPSRHCVELCPDSQTYTLPAISAFMAVLSTDAYP